MKHLLLAYPLVSLVTLSVLATACASASGHGDAESTSGGTGGLGPGAAGAATAGGGGSGGADPCAAGVCAPRGFPFVVSARAITDACVDRGCPLLPADTPAGETTATLSQPAPGTLCLAGIVSADGWANLGVLFALRSADRTEVLKTFDADALGITQLAFTLDSPPSQGIEVYAAITLATSCPADKTACSSSDFTLMTAPGGSSPVRITSPGRISAPLSNFAPSDGNLRFDTTRLDNLRFRVGPGSYDFCVHDFGFLDAAGNEVKAPE